MRSIRLTASSAVFVVILTLAVRADGAANRTQHHHHNRNSTKLIHQRLINQRIHHNTNSRIEKFEPANFYGDDRNDSGTIYAVNWNGKHWRNVCVKHKEVAHPIKTKEVICRPTLKKYQEKCHQNQMCTNVRLVFERAYRDVVTTKHTKHLTYECCPGWAKIHSQSHDCNKPVCQSDCQNGGVCVKPNVCNCQTGFAGKSCENDIDECRKKPCDQICTNTNGSFKCECREGFVLKEDGQSCAKDVFESELEGADDLDLALYENRISKLEKMFDDVNPEELKIVRDTYTRLEKHVNYIEDKLGNMEQYKQEIHIFKQLLSQMERRTGKVEEFIKKYENTKLNYF